MKKSLLIIAVLTLLMPCVVGAQSPLEFISDADRADIERAVYLMDNDSAEQAVTILDRLCKKYSDNYAIQYERLYAVYKAGDYKRVVKDGKALLSNPDVEPQCYQMVGNALDVIGKTDDAVKMYDKGLEKFPESGILRLEKGNIHYMHKRYNEALTEYTRGIEAEPSFPSNYYRAALLYAGSTEPLWAIMYAEVVRNLIPQSDRAVEMSELMSGLYRENIKWSSDTSVNVTLTQNHTVTMDKDTSNIVVPFDLAYELAVTANVPQIGKFDRMSIRQMADLRRYAIEFLDSIMPGYYDVSLIDFHRRLIKSDNWLAYNMWLLHEGNEDEFSEWYETDEGRGQMERFINWCNANRFVPTSDAPTVATRTYKKNKLSIPPIDEVKTADGCKRHNDDALRIAKWIIHDNEDGIGYTTKTAFQFLFMWMTNTPDFKFDVIGSDLLNEGGAELTMVYLAAMIEHGMEFNVNQTDEAMYCTVMLQVVDYYKRHKDRIGSNEVLEKYASMSGSNLRESFANLYKNRGQ